MSPPITSTCRPLSGSRSILPDAVALWSWSATTAPSSPRSAAPSGGSIAAGCACLIRASASSRPGPSGFWPRRRPACTSSSGRSRSRPSGRTTASPPDADATRVDCAGCRPCARSAPGRQAPAGRVKLSAAPAPTSGQLVIEAQSITKSLGDRTIVRDFSTRIMRGDRVGIVGPNGCGKTTLLRLLTGVLAPDAGTVRLGTGLAISCIDQRRETLDLDATPWQTLCPAGGDHVSVRGRPQHVIGYLRDFLFRPEQARTAIRALSGGERNRLLLATPAGPPGQSAGARRADQRSGHGHVGSAPGGPGRLRRHLAPGQPRPRLPRSPGNQRHCLRGQRTSAGIRGRLQRHAAPAAGGPDDYRQNASHGEVPPGEARWAEDTAACPQPGTARPRPADRSDRGPERGDRAARARAGQLRSVST